jgi:glycosyltransferase involved in cell wall biosynthesis
MAPVQVCFATLGYPPAPGGVAHSAARVVSYLREAQFDIRVFTPTFGEQQNTARPLAPTLEQGVQVFRIPWNTQAEISTNILDFYTAIQDSDAVSPFDIFHGYFLPLAYPCILVAGAQRPVVASIRGDDAVTGLCSPEFFPFINVVLQRSTWITSVSRDLLAAVSGLADIAARSSIIPNAIAAFGLSRWRLTAANGGIVGTIGTRPKKAPALLVEAYAGIDPAQRKALHIIGDVSDSAEIARVRAAIARYGLASEVQMLGMVPHANIRQHLLAMHVYVQCSYHDGLPNALLEAAVLGVPVVATAVGGMKDVLTDGASALLVPRGDAAALTSAITAVLQDDQLARRLSHGASTVAGQLSPHHEKHAWLALYQRHLGRS